MGENKMSYGIQQAMGKVPDSDQQVSNAPLKFEEGCVE